MKTPAERVRLAYCVALRIKLADRWAKGSIRDLLIDLHRLRGNVWIEVRFTIQDIRGDNKEFATRPVDCLNWSFIWDESTGAAAELQNRTTPAYYLYERHVSQDCWISPWKIWSRAQLEIEAIWPLASLLFFWELSPFQPRLCVASIFHTSDNASQPRAATLIFILYCSRLRNSARHSEPCNSVISKSSILACAADKQPNTEVMNKSQYSTHTHLLTRGGGPFIWCILRLFWRILNPIWRTVSCCSVWLRFRDHCWQRQCAIHTERRWTKLNITV